MGNLAFQYGPLTVAIQDVGNLGTSFSYSLLGAQFASATSTTGSGYTTVTAAANAALAAAQLAVGTGFNVIGAPALGLNFTNALSGPNTMFPAADSPGAAASAIDDDFSGNYLNSKWTLTANGTATTTTQKLVQGSYTLYPTITVAINVSMLTTPVPSQSFEVTAKINANGITATGPFSGMILGDQSGTAATSKLVAIGVIHSANTVTYATYTNSTTSYTSVATAAASKRPQYWKINFNLALASQVYYNWSEDGVTFWNQGNVFPSHYTGTLALAALSGFTTSTSSFLTSGLAGFIGFGGNSGIVANGGQSISCEWIRQTG